MAKSPGHAKWPDHHILERPLGQRVTVEVDGERIADSHSVIQVREDGNPDRYYFPREDVRTEKLIASSVTTECPFKGTAHYFSLQRGGTTLPEAVWSYDDPYDEHHSLRGRLAFYEEKFPQIEIRVEAQPSRQEAALPRID